MAYFFWEKTMVGWSPRKTPAKPRTQRANGSDRVFAGVHELTAEEETLSFKVLERLYPRE